MRIAIFNWRCFRHPQAGGAELYLHDQAKLWAEDGHEIVWYTSRPSGAARVEVRDGIRFVRAGGTFTVYLRAALNYRREGRPNVVVDVENGIPFFAKLYAGVPVVLLIYHVHTAVWQKEASWLTARIGRWLEGVAMPRLYRKNQIVTISNSSAAMIDELFGPHGPLDIVYSAINPALKPGAKADAPDVIYLGRLRKYKSVDDLLRAVKQIEDLAPTLHLVGQGEDEPRLRALVQELGLERVVFHGFVDDEEKSRLFQRSWVAVNPSSMEGWGITNIEANACGTPAVGADVPGTRDSISAGESGYLFPHGDVHALAAHLRKLIENQELRHRLERTSLEWASRFSWKESARSFMRILERAAGIRQNAEPDSLPDD